MSNTRPAPGRNPDEASVTTEESAPDAQGVIWVRPVKRACLRCGGPAHGYAGCPDYDANLD